MDKVEKEKNDRLESIGVLLRKAQTHIDFPINATPSGAERDALTDINIHIGAALLSLQSALLLAEKGKK